MGMMLRRNDRKGEYAPTVNKKPVVQEPKNRSLSKKANTTTSYTNYNK